MNQVVEFIEAERAEHPISQMCSHLNRDLDFELVSTVGVAWPEQAYVCSRASV